MAREVDEILRQQIARPADSCKFGDNVSFLDQVILPLYEVMAAVCLSDHPLVKLKLKEVIFWVYFIL